MNKDLKSFLLVFICVVSFAFLWKFIIISVIIWLVLRFIAREYIKFKYKGEDEYVSKWDRS